MFNAEYISALIPDSLPLLKTKMLELIKALEGLDKSRDTFGMVHFDFNDGNYCVDFDTAQITVFDFDNSCFCWYLFDLAAIWQNGMAWFRDEENATERKNLMGHYFQTVLDGYKSQTGISESMLEKLPLFLQVNNLEIIVSHFECLRDGDNEGIDDIWLLNAIKCLEEDIPYNGFFLEA